MNIIDVIKSRHSVRSYLDKEIEQEKVEALQKEIEEQKEHIKEQINEAIQSENPLSIVPQTDRNGQIGRNRHVVGGARPIFLYLSLYPPLSISLPLSLSTRI